MRSNLWCGNYKREFIPKFFRLGGFFLILPALLNACCGRTQDGRSPVSQIDTREVGRRILVIAPHPDDENLATAGIIRESLNRGAEVLIVVITSGDASIKACKELSQGSRITPEMHRKVGILRCNESKRAMRRLGVPRENVIFLGFPDGSVNFLWDTNWDMSNLHMGLNGCKRSPYAFSFVKRVPFCGKVLKDNLKRIIARFKPSSIFYPDPEDLHHDHWAVNAFVQYALAELNFHAKEFLYLVHRRDFPHPRGYAPYHGLFPPAKLIPRKEKWLVLHLAPETVRLKALITKMYALPMAVAPNMLLSFVRRNEIFALPSIEVLKKAKKGRNSDAAETPEVAVIDPDGDTLSVKRPAGDIKKLLIKRGKRALNLRLELSGKPSGEFTYRIHLRIFKKKKTLRFDIRVSEGNCSIEKIASNSISANSSMKTLFKSNSIEAVIPEDILREAIYLLMGADVYFADKMYDRCAWKRVKLE